MKPLRLIRGILALWGAVTAAMAALAFTALPDRGMEWLAGGAPYKEGCDYIVPLPGGAIPSPSGLMRAYRGAAEAVKSPRAKVIISLKINGNPEKSHSAGIRDELALRGVDPRRIIFEPNATNTAGHARYIRELAIGDPERDSYLIVSSPSHIRRAVMVFRAAGFKHIYAAPASSNLGMENLGDGLLLRYTFWMRLAYEVTIAREVTAMGWYLVTGRL